MLYCSAIFCDGMEAEFDAAMGILKGSPQKMSDAQCANVLLFDAHIISYEFEMERISEFWIILAFVYVLLG